MDYQITRKRNMKRIVLRVKSDAEGQNPFVCVSAPPWVTQEEINRFVRSKASWIEKQLAKPPTSKQVLEKFDDDACLKKFGEAAENVYPLVARKVRTQPEMRVKDYKSRWGVCYHKRGYIILNKQLFNKPQAAIEYVVLHEYVHFIVPNHGAKFHKIMQELMPDYKERRAMLR